MVSQALGQASRDRLLARVRPARLPAPSAARPVEGVRGRGVRARGEAGACTPAQAAAPAAAAFGAAGTQRRPVPAACRHDPARDAATRHQVMQSVVSLPPCPHQLLRPCPPATAAPLLRCRARHGARACPPQPSHSRAALPPPRSTNYSCAASQTWQVGAAASMDCRRCRGRCCRRRLARRRPLVSSCRGSPSPCLLQPSCSRISCLTSSGGWRSRCIAWRPAGCGSAACGMFATPRPGRAAATAAAQRTLAHHLLAATAACARACASPSRLCGCGTHLRALGAGGVC